MSMSVIADSEAKFWLKPDLLLATSVGLSPRQIKEARDLVVVHMEEVVNAWYAHFPS